MRKEKNVKGITLIALVVTLIVLLILAGVSIATLAGKNGIITMAIKAKNNTEVAAEKEAIELMITLTEMGEGMSSYYIGTPLHDKAVNESNWNMIVIKDTYETYGTNWNYINIGTEIPDYGKTKYAWVINYITGQVIYLEENNYKMLSKTLAVTDNLIFNMDASNFNEDASNWGENVTLYYYDSNIYDTVDKRLEAYNEQAAYDSVTDYAGYDRQIATNARDYIDLTNYAFKFNGNNYIEIEENNGFDFSEGLTFEFYGNISGQPIGATIASNNFEGLFGLWNGKYSNQCPTRFGLTTYGAIKYSLVNFRSGITDFGSWSISTDPWNQRYYVDNLFNNDIYFSIVLEPTTSGTITQKIYMNGILLDSGYITQEYYNVFLDNVQNMKYLNLGRCTMGQVSNWCYAVGSCYTIRMYNKALTDNEIANNCNDTIIYHNSLLKND